MTGAGGSPISAPAPRSSSTPPAGERLKTFAAHDDPNTLDRQLVAEIAHHEQVLAAGPPDVADRLARALQGLAELDRRVADTRMRADYAQQQAAEIGPVAALRKHNRQQRESWEYAAAANRSDLRQAEHARAEQTARLGELAQADAARRAWQASEGWRAEQIDTLRHQLDAHWARVVVGGVRQGDPLAYGIDRLRRTHTTVAADLRCLEGSLPPDRRRQLGQAEAEMRRLHDDRRAAVHAKETATARLAEASRRRFGLRDKTAIVAAEQSVNAVRSRLGDLQVAIGKTRAVVAAEQASVEARARAEARSADRRRALTADLGAVGDALDTTRPERVLAAEAGHPAGQHLRDLLGAAPTHPAGRQKWRAIAERVEHVLDDPDERDRLTWSRQPTDHLVDQLVAGSQWAMQQTRQIVQDTEAVTHAATRGRPAVARVATMRPPLPSPRQDHGIDRGL